MQKLRVRFRIWSLMVVVAVVAALLSMNDKALTLSLPIIVPSVLILFPAAFSAPGHRTENVYWAIALHPLLYLLWLSVGRFLLNPWQLRPTGASERLFFSLELPFAIAWLSCLYMPVLLVVGLLLDSARRSLIWPLKVLPLTWLIMMAVCWCDPFQLFVWFLD